VPLIVETGYVGEEKALDYIKQGAGFKAAGLVDRVGNRRATVFPRGRPCSGEMVQAVADRVTEMAMLAFPESSFRKWERKCKCSQTLWRAN
jgi:hypothetical protein